jgi:hypothetical protein
MFTEPVNEIIDLDIPSHDAEIALAGQSQNNGIFEADKISTKYAEADKKGSPFTRVYNWIKCPHFVSSTQIQSGSHIADIKTVDRFLPLKNAGSAIKDASAELHSSGIQGNTQQQQHWLGKVSADTSKCYMISPLSATDINNMFEATQRPYVKNVKRFNQLRTCILPTGTPDISQVAKNGICGDELYLINKVKFNLAGNRLYYNTTGTGFTLSTTGASVHGKRLLGYTDSQTWILLAPPDFDASGDLSGIFNNDTPWGFYLVTAGQTGYFDISLAHPQAPKGWRGSDWINADVISCNQWFNGYGAHPDFRQVQTAGGYDNDVSPIENANANPSSCAYQLKTTALRPDAVTMPYIPFTGSKLLTYQGLTGRPANHRTPPVKFKAATVINGMAVVGNIDISDKKNQSLRETNRILWTAPMHLDEFSFGKSRDIGVNDGDEIIALEVFQGRLFCLKKNNIYILNPTNGFREEGRVSGVGVMSEHAYVKTPYGIACANKEQITLLPSKEVLSSIIENAYKAESKNNVILGYSGKHDELIYIPNSYSTGTKIYRFGFKTKAWSIETYSDKMQFSNIIYDDDDGALVVGMIDSGTCSVTSHTDKDACESNEATWSPNNAIALYKLDDHTTNFVQGDAILKTKEFIFDAPELKKYISDLKMTYTATDTIVVKLYVDGNYSGEKSFSASTKKTNKTMKINRQCNSISFEIIQTATSATSNFEIDDILIEGWHNARGEQ